MQKVRFWEFQSLLYTFLHSSFGRILTLSPFHYRQTCNKLSKICSSWWCLQTFLILIFPGLQQNRFFTLLHMKFSRRKLFTLLLVIWYLWYAEYWDNFKWLISLCYLYREIYSLLYFRAFVYNRIFINYLRFSTTVFH